MRYIRIWDDGPDPGVILIPVDPAPVPGEVDIDTSDLLGGDTVRIPEEELRAFAELSERIAKDYERKASR